MNTPQSDTPRTDALVKNGVPSSPSNWFEMAELAHKLERDLNKATANWKAELAGNQSFAAKHALEGETWPQMLTRIVEERDKAYASCSAESLDILEESIRLRKELSKWKAVAGELADTLKFIRDECDWEGPLEARQGSSGDYRIGPACTKAISKYKKLTNEHSK